MVLYAWEYDCSNITEYYIRLLITAYRISINVQRVLNSQCTNSFKQNADIQRLWLTTVHKTGQ